MAKYNAWTICDDGSGQESGLFAEMRLAALFMNSGISFKWVAAEKRYHDFEVTTTSGAALLIDVKCKQRNVPFDPKHHGHVEERIKSQPCHIYVFAHAESQDLTAPAITLAGWIGKKAFWEAAQMVKKGGKDSDLVLRLALIVAEEKGRLPLPVMWLDQEIEWQMVSDHAKSVMYDPRVDPRWMQIPFLISNATSSESPWLDCWDPEKEPNWIREKDPISIKENTFGEKRFHKMFKSFFKKWYPDSPAIYLAGIRTEESPTRYTAMTASATYKGETWAKVLDADRKHFTFYPIYDWGYTDVWKAIHDNGWPYCKIYDYYYQYGTPIREMRVSNLNHETAVRSLFIAHEIEPKTWSRITNRLQVTNTAAVLQDDMNKCPKKLPFMFNDWQEYRDYLLDRLITDPDKRGAFARKFARMDIKFADMLQKEKMHKVQISSLLANDYEGVLTDNWITGPQINNLLKFWKGQTHPNNLKNPHIDWSKFNVDGSRIAGS